MIIEFWSAWTNGLGRVFGFNFCVHNVSTIKRKHNPEWDCMCAILSGDIEETERAGRAR